MTTPIFCHMNDHSEIILTGWFAFQETFIIYNVECSSSSSFYLYSTFYNSHWL